MAVFDSEPWLQDLDRSNTNCEKFLQPWAARFVLHVSGKEKKIEQIFVSERCGLGPQNNCHSLLILIRFLMKFALPLM